MAKCRRLQELRRLKILELPDAIDVPGCGLLDAPGRVRARITSACARQVDRESTRNAYAVETCESFIACVCACARITSATRRPPKGVLAATLCV